MATLAQLADKMRRLESKVREGASEIAKDVSLTILADVAVKTPADTSKAASNWQVSLSSPVNLEIDAYSPGIAGSTAQSSVDAAYQAGVAAIANKKPGQSVFISNVTQYIDYLNQGSSTQAPSGFVERAVMLGRKQTKNTKVKLVKSGR